MKRLALGAAGLAAAAAVVAAFFLHADDSADRCFKEQGNTAIEACSRAIGSGRFAGADLAAIYDNRAIELRQRGDYDGAIADYSQALNIDAELTGAYAGRGLAYEGKAEVEKAKADYLKALAVAPKYDDGQWAHDIARTRLAALTASS
jgi:tetratricopeptide (TPR) repeat protein